MCLLEDMTAKELGRTLVFFINIIFFFVFILNKPLVNNCFQSCLNLLILNPLLALTKYCFDFKVCYYTKSNIGIISLKVFENYARIYSLCLDKEVFIFAVIINFQMLRGEEWLKQVTKLISFLMTMQKTILVETSKQVCEQIFNFYYTKIVVHNNKNVFFQIIYFIATTSVCFMFEQNPETHSTITLKQEYFGNI